MQDQYNSAAKVMHWLMALGFFFMWGCAFAMIYVVPEDSHIEHVLFQLHISVGVSLFFLLMLRIAIRLISKPPALSEVIPAIERMAAHLGHLALYILPLAIIVIGWAEVDMGGYGVKWFGFEVPKIFPTMEYLAGFNVEKTTETLHKWLAWAMLGLVAVHIAAVFKHKIDGHDVLNRMLWSKKQ